MGSAGSSNEASDEVVVVRATDGTHFAILESTTDKGQSYATAESFATLKQLIKWVIDEADYYLPHSAVKEVQEIVNSGGVAIIDFPSGSLTIHKASNRNARLPEVPKEEVNP